MESDNPNDIVEPQHINACRNGAQNGQPRDMCFVVIKDSTLLLYENESTQVSQWQSRYNEIDGLRI